MFIYNRLHFIVGLIGITLLTSCGAGVNDPGKEYSPNMYHAVPYEPLKQIKDVNAGNWVSSLDNGEGEYFSSNPINPDSMNMREPVPNTVRRSKKGFLPYRVPKDSISWAAANLKNPLDSTQVVIADGKVLYDKFCAHCHGTNGKGDGKVGKVYQGVPSYTSRPVKDYSEGHIFHVITHGIRRMGAHGSQLSIEERWKIVRYVQKLQNQ
ncbi:cytochrome c [Fulvivirgaceae bacterium BMA12]|uniref:Cytochrome c n=1 Tax=Agaribacillus aureus TaxID=3051825 RepID=A0ABT8L4F2_9BACT|nr:cytochrome c [Fulvivirgaceae bacterium BMA12]